MCEMIFLGGTELNVTYSVLSFAVVEAIMEVSFVHCFQQCPFCFIASEFANQSITESLCLDFCGVSCFSEEHKVFLAVQSLGQRRQHQNCRHLSKPNGPVAVPMAIPSCTWKRRSKLILFFSFFNELICVCVN